MISNEDVATIADCAKRKDRKGLVDWVRSKRDAVWILDTNKEVTLSRFTDCLLYTSPSPRDRQKSRMPSSA